MQVGLARGTRRQAGGGLGPGGPAGKGQLGASAAGSCGSRGSGRSTWDHAEDWASVSPGWATRLFWNLAPLQVDVPPEPGLGAGVNRLCPQA